MNNYLHVEMWITFCGLHNIIFKMLINNFAKNKIKKRILRYFVFLKKNNKKQTARAVFSCGFVIFELGFSLLMKTVC